MLALFTRRPTLPALQTFRLIVGGRIREYQGRELELSKADSASGSRWITVHPNGKDEKGVPVLIQETAHGSGVFHVVGGAGGKLNYLKLRGVKSKEHYAAEVKQKQQARRDADKEKVKREKEQGVHVSRQAQRKEVQETTRKAERQFIETVAKHAGWDEKELKPDPAKLAGLSEAAAGAALKEHHRGLLARATEDAKLQQQALAAAADKRLSETLNEPELEQPDGKLGYEPHFGERTKSQAADIKAEAQAADAGRVSPEQRAALTSAHAKAKAIRDEVSRSGITTDLKSLKSDVLDAAKALEILKARKALQKVRAAAKKAGAAIDRGEEKAYVIEVGNKDVSDADIQRDVDNDIRTARTRAFLSEVGKVEGGQGRIAPHVALGAYNSMNSAGLVLSGASIIDRDTLDVLGIAGAAQAIATRLRADLNGGDYQKATDAMELYHLDHYMKKSEDTLREAAELQDKITELTIPDANDGHDLAAAHEINARRRRAVEELQKTVGHALGEMEANAALLVALKSRDDTAKIALGKMPTEDAIKRMRAIGLQRGDYQIEHAGGDVIATINAEGLKHVTAPVDAEHAARMRDSMDIINGRQDDPGFWPKGVAQRPDLSLPPPAPPSSPGLGKPFTAGADMAASMRDYIGGRMADGHAIGDIVGDLQTEDIARLAGDRRDDYFKALNELVPLAGADGKPMEHEARRGDFEKMADAFVGHEYGGKLSPIHSQSFEVDKPAVEALHRAFSEHPAGPLAFKGVSDLSPADRNSLRMHFDKHVARQDPSAASDTAELAGHLKAEPEKEVDDMFGRGRNPAWTEWSNKAGTMREALAKKGLSWDKYKEIMGSSEAAYAAVQDHLRGAVVAKFQAEHAKLKPGSVLKLGSTVLSNHLRHIEAVDPAARERRQAEHQALVDRLRNRVGGKYSGGAVADKMDAAREHQAAFEQSQLGMFATRDSDAARPLEADERPTIGAAAESRLGQMADLVGQNFKPGQPVKMWQPSMSGKFINQQRAIKLIDRNKRMALAQGVGSGKTSMGLSAFAHAHEQGKAGRGLFIVPSIVQGQFGHEALSILEPGKFKWHANPGAGREERLKAYADPSTHFSVVTHQAFRDDLVHLGAQHAGVHENEMADRVNKMSETERSAWAKDTMAKAGINHNYMMVDEGHDLLNRKGKQNSLMANVLDAASSNMDYYVNSTADPIKNDATEAFDVLHKLDPKRFTDRNSFMRRYGVDTVASREALRREMSAYFYPGRIDPGVRILPSERKVTLSDAQQQAMKDVEGHVAALRTAKIKGGVDIEAAKALSPDSFEGVPEERHGEVARGLADSAGILRETALSRVIDAHPAGAKLDEVVKVAKERRGKPGVVFARSLAAVKNITQRLQDAGFRTVSITGKDSAKEKYAKRLKFKPENGGEPEADILVASDAGAVGMNAQRGAWLVQNDTPMTAKTHAQRNGRIARLGQKNPDIELIDLVGDHPSEDKSRQRLKQKYALREVMTSPLEGLDDTGLAPYLRAQHQAEQTEAKAA